MNKHIITDEEAQRAVDIYNNIQGYMSAMKAALTDFLNNRPQVAQLRPIAEMPGTVPEGCKRITVGLNQHGNINNMCANGHSSSGCSLFVDLQLPTPDPDAEERRKFEEWYLANVSPECNFTKSDFWIVWKLAKKGGDK